MPAQPPEIRELDFSQWHPLDHAPWSQRCQEFPGGWKHHLSLAWEYKWSARFCRALRCPLSLHRYVRAWQAPAPGAPMQELPSACFWCGKRKRNDSIEH